MIEIRIYCSEISGKTEIQHPLGQKQKTKLCCYYFYYYYCGSYIVIDYIHYRSKV